MSPRAQALSLVREGGARCAGPSSSSGEDSRQGRLWALSSGSPTAPPSLTLSPFTPREVLFIAPVIEVFIAPVTSVRSRDLTRAARCETLPQGWELLKTHKTKAHVQTGLLPGCLASVMTALSLLLLAAGACLTPAGECLPNPPSGAGRDLQLLCGYSIRDRLLARPGL